MVAQNKLSEGRNTLGGTERISRESWQENSGEILGAWRQSLAQTQHKQRLHGRVWSGKGSPMKGTDWSGAEGKQSTRRQM